jgi:hypothetical protein
VVADRRAAAVSILRLRRNEPNFFASFKAVVAQVVLEAEEAQEAEALQALVVSEVSVVQIGVEIGAGPADPQVATLVEAEVVVVDSFDSGVCSERIFYSYF